jgi:hypothetical protein
MEATACRRRRRRRRSSCMSICRTPCTTPRDFHSSWELVSWERKTTIVEQAATGAAELRKRVSGDRKRIVPPENHDRRPDHGQRQRARVGPLPKFDQILRKFARLVYMVQVGSQKYRSMVFFFFFTFIFSL